MSGMNGKRNRDADFPTHQVGDEPAFTTAVDPAVSDQAVVEDVKVDDAPSDPWPEVLGQLDDAFVYVPSVGITTNSGLVLVDQCGYVELCPDNRMTRARPTVAPGSPIGFKFAIGGL